VCTWPPNASTPAACIRRIAPPGGIVASMQGCGHRMLLVPMLRKAL
jgi:hypothetical protein